MSTFIKCIIIAIVAASIHFFQEIADKERFSEKSDSYEYVRPNSQAISALSLGQQVFVGDLMWVHSILRFADFAEHCNPVQGEWLYSMLRTIAELDSQWRTLYMYGGAMMDVCQMDEEAAEIYSMGHSSMPEEFYFPFALAMNAQLSQNDPENAEHWMRIAQGYEDAPAYFQAAVAGFLNKHCALPSGVEVHMEECNSISI